MNRTARIFLYNRSQAVRLPKDFRFDVDEVFIRKQGSEVVLSPRPPCGAVVGLRDANPHRCSMLQYLLFRSSVASTNWRSRFLRLLDEFDDLLSTNRGKSGQKIVDRLSGIQVIKERLNRHPSAGKDCCAPITSGLQEITGFPIPSGYSQLRGWCNFGGNV